MHNYYPILWVGAIIGVISTLLIVAAFVVKDGEKETGFERNMNCLLYTSDAADE